MVKSSVKYTVMEVNRVNQLLQLEEMHKWAPTFFQHLNRINNPNFQKKIQKKCTFKCFFFQFFFQVGINNNSNLLLSW